MLISSVFVYTSVSCKQRLCFSAFTCSAHLRKIVLTGLFGILTCVAIAQQKSSERARDLGIPFEGVTGKHNAITDVSGLEVGYKTIIEGTGALVRGKGPVRTGVTVILPKGNQ